MIEKMRRAWVFGVVLTALACSGSETGNPTRSHTGGGCRPAYVIFDVSSSDGAALTQVTLDGDAAPCELVATGARCTLLDPTEVDQMDHVLTIEANGHEAKQVQLMVGWGTGKCAEGQNVVKVELQPIVPK